MRMVLQCRCHRISAALQTPISFSLGRRALTLAAALLAAPGWSPLPPHSGWRWFQGWPGTISEFLHILGVNLLEIDEMFWNGRKNILSRIKSTLSYAASGVSDGWFIRASSKVSTTALMIAYSVPQYRCKICLLCIKMVLRILAIEWSDSFPHVCSRSGTELHYVCSVITASLAKWRSCCIGHAKSFPPTSI